MSYKVGFIGYGNMAQAISDGLARVGLIPYDKQTAFDTNKNQNRYMLERGVDTAHNSEELLNKTPVIILAVKPPYVLPVLEANRGNIKDQLFISIAAGVTLHDLYRSLHPEQTVRVMPNIAAISGHCMTLICAHQDIDEEKYNQAKAIFNAIGPTLELEEKLFDAGTAISGSGPAYIFAIMDALASGGVRMGLTRKDAEELVIHTILGSAKLAQQRREAAFSTLRDLVTSPGGTTAEGLFVMAQAGIGGTMQKVVEEVTKKSANLK